MGAYICKSSGARMRITGFLSAIIILTLCGCGAGDATSSQPSVPLIVTQPGDQQVPLGQAATFSVVASGTQVLTYQWQRGGVNIQGATSASYSIQSTSLSDASSVFDVVVANSVGEVTSNNAKLSIGARYPATGDLRFQQVDAITTVNGSVALAGTNLLGATGYQQSNAFGTPLSIGPSCYPSGGTLGPEIDCGWLLYTFYLPAASPSLSVGYQSFYYSDLQSTLSTFSVPAIVITGMDLEPVANATAFSWMQQVTGPGFDGVLHTVSLSDLQNAVQAEGSLGRVVTGVSYNNSQVSFLSYGWQGNDTTTYDAEAITATIDNAAAVATTMAEDGYILTAIGGNEYSGVLLVGTRVHGDSLPRPILVVPGGQSPTALSTQGYATVAVLYSGTTGFVDWIGER
jgi:hypothetical protein